MTKLIYASTATAVSTMLSTAKILGLVVLLSGQASFAQTPDRGPTSFGPGGQAKAKKQIDSADAKSKAGDSVDPNSLDAACRQFTQAQTKGDNDTMNSIVDDNSGKNPCMMANPNNKPAGNNKSAKGSPNKGSSKCVAPYNGPNCKPVVPK